MLAFFASCLQRVLSSEIVGLTVGHNSTAAASKFIYRDELSNIAKQKPGKLKNCNGFSYSSSKPLLKVKKEDIGCEKLDGGERSCCGGGDDGKAKAAATMRVKVKMTKQEAARLLSKCKEGGVIEFRDVARELVNLPVDRVTVLSPCPPAINPMLDSIPEEY